MQVQWHPLILVQTYWHCCDRQKTQTFVVMVVHLQVCVKKERGRRGRKSERDDSREKGGIERTGKLHSIPNFTASCNNFPVSGTLHLSLCDSSVNFLETSCNFSSIFPRLVSLIK